MSYLKGIVMRRSYPSTKDANKIFFLKNHRTVTEDDARYNL